MSESSRTCCCITIFLSPTLFLPLHYFQSLSPLPLYLPPVFFILPLSVTSLLMILFSFYSHFPISLPCSSLFIISLIHSQLFLLSLCPHFFLFCLLQHYVYGRTSFQSFDCLFLSTCCCIPKSLFCCIDLRPKRGKCWFSSHIFFIYFCI